MFQRDVPHNGEPEPLARVVLPPAEAALKDVRQVLRRMPQPVSRTSTTAQPPSRRSESVMLPSSGVKERAL